MDKHFVRVCNAGAVEEGRIKAVMVEDREILLIKEHDVIYALENVCSHDRGDLGEGIIVESQIECPRHGGRFDFKTGQATQMPAVAEIESFEVKVENGDVFVAVQD